MVLLFPFTTIVSKGFLLRVIKIGDCMVKNFKTLCEKEKMLVTSIFSSPEQEVLAVSCSDHSPSVVHISLFTL